MTNIPNCFGNCSNTDKKCAYCLFENESLWNKCFNKKINNNMTKEEVLKYCYKHANEFKRDMYACGEDGERQFECLIELPESESIKPSELTDYGMKY